MPEFSLQYKLLYYPLNRLGKVSFYILYAMIILQLSMILFRNCEGV